MAEKVVDVILKVASTERRAGERSFVLSDNATAMLRLAFAEDDETSAEVFLYGRKFRVTVTPED